MPPTPVLHEFFAVITEHQHDRIFEQTILLEVIDDATKLAVEMMDRIDITVLDQMDVAGQLLSAQRKIVDIFGIRLTNHAFGGK